MEIDVGALQRLPEVTEVAGLRPIRCVWNTRTKVLCGGSGKTCTKTMVVVRRT
jgi:hypothetical protein